MLLLVMAGMPSWSMRVPHIRFPFVDKGALRPRGRPNSSRQRRPGALPRELDYSKGPAPRGLFHVRSNLRKG